MHHSLEEENEIKNVDSDEVILILPSTPKRERRVNGPLVESKVRRSPRTKELNGGFQNHVPCNDKSLP
jgi:hypothetical protein